MRPDEHKKKNTAYKKKHGIVKDAGDKRDEKTKKDKSTVHTKKNDGCETETKPHPHSLSSSLSTGSRRHGTKDLTAAKAENSSSNVSSSDTESEETTSRKAPSKFFRKRQIVSNWQKYDLPPEAEETISARGEKYDKLLSMTGEAISHFRFKDELVWDDPGEATHESSVDVYSQFLSVNPTELAQSLACLPVHHILGISSSVFPDEQLSSIVNMAKDIRSQYAVDMTEENTGYTSLPDMNEPIESSASSRLHSSPEYYNDNAVTEVMASSKQTKTTLMNTSLLAPIDSVNVQSYPPDIAADINAGFVCEETRNGKIDSVLKDPVDKLELQDDDLDALLNTDNPSEVSGGGRSSSIQSRKAEGDSKLASESEDLEAWLDSVLDE